MTFIPMNHMEATNLDLEKVRKLSDEDLRLLIQDFHKIEGDCAAVCNADTCKYLPLLQKIGAEPCERVGLYQLCAEGHDPLVESGYSKMIRDDLVKKYGKWMSNFFAKDEFNKSVHEERPISDIQEATLHFKHDN